MSFFKTLTNPSTIALSLLILIEHIGYGIFFPILGPVFMDPNGILAFNASPLARSFCYNLTLAFFPIALFFGAPILGGLSDQYGRKKVLTGCLLGTFLSYILAGLAIHLKLLPLLLFSRAVAGLTAGCMPIAQAAIVDLSSEETKAQNLGLMIFVASIGFLLGPFIGGVFANSSISTLFDYSTPFYVAGILALLNLVFLVFLFKETLFTRIPQKLNWMICMELCLAPFKMREIRFLSIIYFFVQLGWSFYFQFISLFLIKKHEYSSQDIAYFMTLMGVGFAIGSCWGTRILRQYLSDKNLITTCLILVTLAMGTTFMELPRIMVWIDALILGITMSIVYSLMVTLYSNMVSDDKQGWIMGVSESIVAVAWATTPLLSTYLESFTLTLPLQTAFLMIIISVGLFKFYRIQ